MISIRPPQASARPGGGRAAPALGGGSGAGRFFKPDLSGNRVKPQIVNNPLRAIHLKDFKTIPKNSLKTLRKTEVSPK